MLVCDGMRLPDKGYDPPSAPAAVAWEIMLFWGRGVAAKVSQGFKVTKVEDALRVTLPVQVRESILFACTQVCLLP